MVKGNSKTSASSATRKKHAKKHEDPVQDTKGGKGQKGGKKNKEPRVKMYIPPVKPAPVQPDPLETTGLAHSLPAELLVVLRNLSKKAQVTKVRALEDLQAAWVDKCLKDGDEATIHTLVEMLPVWLHHLPSLLLNPSRRVRLVAATLQSSFLQIQEVYDQSIFFLRETASSSQLENILGALFLASQDIDRSVATVASKAWEKFITTSKDADASVSSTEGLYLDDTTRSSLTSFIQRAALDPNGLYTSFNPVALPAPALVTHLYQAKKGSAKESQVPTPRKDDGGDQTPRSKFDEGEESDQDRVARLRIGALGALGWLLDVTSSLSEDLRDIFANVAFWTVLTPHRIPVWVNFESFGFKQPNVRKAAWTLVQSLLRYRHNTDALDPLVPILSIVVLRSAWVEVDPAVQGVMWQPLLTFLKAFPQSWTLELRGVDDLEEAGNQGQDNPEENTKASGAYQEFLQFLELGCSGSPIQGYPTIVIILSTIPPSILLSSSDRPLLPFFTAFWVAVDGRALSSLHRTAAAAAFLSSLLECTIFLLKRIQNAAEESRLTVDEDGAVVLLKELFSRVWIELATQKLNLEEETLAKLMPQTLGALMDLNRMFFDAAWEALTGQMTISSNAGTRDAAKLLSVILRALIGDSNRRTENRTYLREKADEFMNVIFKNEIERVERLVRGSSEEGSNFDVIEEILEQLKGRLFVDEDLASRWDDLLLEHAFRISSLSPNLLLSYLSYRKDEAKCLTVWHSLLTSLAAGDTIDSSLVKNLLDAAQNGKLPQYLKPQEAELDAVVPALLEKALDGSKQSDETTLLKQILVNSGYFLSSLRFEACLEIIASTFNSSVQLFLEGKEIKLAKLEVELHFVEALFPSIIQHEKLTMALLPYIFDLAYLLPLAFPKSSSDIDLAPSHTISKGLWENWLDITPEAKRRDVIQEVVHSLREFMMDSNIYPLPSHLLQLISQHPPGIHINLLEDVFPSKTQLDAILDEFSPDPNDPSLAVLNDLLPTASHPASKNKIKKPNFTDRHGFSPYARVVNGLAQAFIEDRQLAKRNLWALRHLHALSIYSQDLANVPSSYEYGSPLFDGKISEARLEQVVTGVKQISVYLFNSLNSSGQDEGVWRCAVVERLLQATAGRDASRGGLSDSQVFLFDLLWHAKRRDTVRDARVMKIVVESLLADGVDETEADLWIQLARKFEKIAPEASMAITSVLASLGAESPRLDRYRNELAASLPGIKPHNVNVDGLLTLRKLAASAPNPDSDVSFLPTQRAVNVIKALQAWVLADVEDEDDEISVEVESAMLPVFMSLAPILQSVSGSHWPFMFDVLESALERASGLEEGDQVSDVEQEVERKMEYGVTLVALARALRLTVVIEELTTRNKSLMGDWKERRAGIMKSVLNLEILRPNARYRSSKPFSECRELALSILERLPQSSPLIDESTLPKMVHLLEDTSHKVQRMAYRLLTTAAKKRTEHLVIEAGVATGENDIEYTLPMELLEILKKEVDLEVELDDEMVDVFAYLLGWMVVFDSFTDASFKVRSSYIDQLRTSNIIMETLMPSFLHLLGLDRGGLSKAFKLNIWRIDAFYINHYETGRPHTIPVLMAHVYYRALLTIPSLIYSWVLDCKDRQLTSAVTTYTSTYFSPVLIKTELEHVRTSAASGELVDEKMSVKVVSTSGSSGVTAAGTGHGGGEVMASYSVDDHQLEIRIWIPGDWPLHRVEVKDVKRVGVDENRWRAWVLGVQQTIWAHNGRIVDGLAHFKKNVNLHFEGQVECAICYSIISVMDGSLPKKPCKTCKNRFHAGCLYKWFNTSHSSSCPLCRSDII